MKRFRSYFPQDDAPDPLGDQAWDGIISDTHPGKVAARFGTHGENVRFDQGSVQPRKGIRLLPWGGVSGDPYDSNPTRIEGYGPTAGSGIFADPATGLLWIITACLDGKVYRARPGGASLEVDLPEGETIPSRVLFLQTFSGIVMFRGEGYDPLFCENLDKGFLAIPAPDRGKVRLPRASAAVFWKNRIVAVYAGHEAGLRDSIFVSDVGGISDVLQGPVNFQAFRINQGSRDSLVAVYPFGNNTMLAFKESSIHKVTNVSGTNEDIAYNAAVSPVTSEYGIRAPRAVVQVGADVWFLAHKRGICSIVQTEQGELQAVDVPKSKPIDPYIQRINWAAADNVVAAFWNNAVYFAVPLDGSTSNNAVLVYQTTTGAWSGYDVSDSIRVRDWMEFEVGGVNRLMMCSDNGFLFLYEDGLVDQIPGPNGSVVIKSIQTVFRTRGYGGDMPGRKTFGQANWEVATWWPKYSVTAIFDGVVERKPLVTERTASRVRYRRPYGQANWNPQNPGNDHATPHREDYSVVLPTQGMRIWPSGVRLELHQTVQEGKRIGRSGAHVQLEFRGQQGRVEINSVAIESVDLVSRAGTKS